MYDIRQFKPALYFLLIVGISGFGLAAELPGIWMVGLTFIVLNGCLLAVHRFRPIPRLAANFITILAVVYVAHELLTTMMTPVIVIGEFLVFLQLVKLWEQRANRDYAQLLILSLLLMVAASMNTASLWFGLLLVFYLFLSLYCCLLFHLKVETDAARSAMPAPEEKVGFGALGQDQRYLARSMRRLTGLVSCVALVCAVLVFLLFPRGSGAGLLGPLQSMRNAAPLTGFSDQVSFQDVARITQSHETIAFVKVWHNQREVHGDATLFLRGLTLDAYRPPRQVGGAWEWTRSLSSAGVFAARPDAPLILGARGKNVWRQEVSLWPTHTDVLFALPGLVEFAPHQPMKVRYGPGDSAIQSLSPLNNRVDYDAVSTGELGPEVDGWGAPIRASSLRERFPRIYQFALQPQVSGGDARGPLAPRRILQGNVSPLDPQIAANIERYLRTHFTYTLDLTDEQSIRGRDPLEAFLYKWRRGHCEYFAGAMTLMCQTLGMQARMVVGFKCDGDDFNSLDSRYTVHDSDAHAWVEVNTPSGWQSFDPTSSINAPATAGSDFLRRARHVMEYLEYTYANAIIAYDSHNRDNVIASVETKLATSTDHGSTLLSDLQQFIRQSAGFWNASTDVLIGFMLLMIAGVAGAAGWYGWERWRLRRRAHLIGLESLAESEQLRLARQLGFYHDLVRLLHRYSIDRPAHFTPMEFSRSLSFLPAEAYDTIRRLTVLFYKVRYGRTELPAARRRRLAHVLSRLAETLGAERRSTGGAAPS